MPKMLECQEERTAQTCVVKTNEKKTHSFVRQANETTSKFMLEYMRKLPQREKGSYRSVHHCDQCMYESKSIFFMLNHVRRHHLPSQLFDCATSSVELYHCKSCDINFDSIVHLRSHVNKHSTHSIQDSELKINISKTCSFTTRSFQQLLKKLNCDTWQTHTESKVQVWLQKRYQCDKCAFETVWRSCFIVHQRAKHSNDKAKTWYACQKCSYKSTLKAYISRHMYAKHTDSRNKKVRCQNGVYKSKIPIHKDEEKSFKCEKCAFKTERRNDLRKHVKIMHKAIKRFGCDKCTFETGWKESLVRHILIKHTARENKIDQLFRCEKCSYESVMKNKIKEHFILKHGSDADKRWFKCNKCSFKTVWQRSLPRHTNRVHAND